MKLNKKAVHSIAEHVAWRQSAGLQGGMRIAVRYLILTGCQ